MKKIILFIMLLSFIFIKPNINVLADSSSPIITWYEAIITNPNGAKTYENAWSSSGELDVVIPYESEVIVLQEYTNYNILYNNKEYWVPREDIAIKNEDFSLGNAYKLAEKVTILTIGESSVYSGPSSKFKKVGTLPTNTEFSYEYVTKKGDSSWVYIEDDNIKGWIQTMGSRGEDMVASKTNITIKLLEDYENTYYNLSIPKDTVLRSFYIYISGNGPGSIGYQVEYNGNKIWIHDSYESIFEITYNDNPTKPEIPKEDTNNNNQEENLPNNEDNNKLDFYTILYLSIGAAVLFSLTALVTIILMNKKNKNNNDNSINNNQTNINQQNNISSSVNELKNETNLNDMNKNNQ